MQFSMLEGYYQKWHEILVIGKTIERDGNRYHIIGLTRSDEVRLYIIEPYKEPVEKRRRGVCNYRRVLKEQAENEFESCYLHCSSICLGNEDLQVKGGTSGSLKDVSEDYGTIRLFFAMMDAGWTIPEWLKEEDWSRLQLVTLDIKKMEQLPQYFPHMPVTITHRPCPASHIVEKPVTLHIGKSASVSFNDHYGERVWCYINDVTLVDVWKDIEEKFQDPDIIASYAPEELQKLKQEVYSTLEQSCPKGKFYIGVAYECSKDLSLVFYSEECLKSKPAERQGSASFLSVGFRPEKETGEHQLPLKGCVVDTPVSPDTTAVAAELFRYFEPAQEWTEAYGGELDD